MEQKDFSRFEDVFFSIEQNTNKQAESLSSLHKLNLYSNPESETVPILARLLDLTEKQVKLNEENVSLNKEQQGREETEDLLGRSENRDPIISRTEPNSMIPDMDFSFSDILKGVAFLPFVYKFAEGFIEEFFDGLIDITPAGVTGAISAINGKYNSLAALISKPLTKSFETFSDSIRLIKDKIRPVTTFASKISNFLSGIAKGVTTGPIGATLKAISGFTGATAMTKLLGRIAWPLTLIIGLYDGVTKFMNTEGSVLEKFVSGIGGFLGEVIGAPLDLLKGVVSWILDKFGWERASKRLSEFSFEETINSLFSGISSFLGSIIQWTKDLFSNPKQALTDLWTSALGAYSSLTDMIFYPIDKAIQWISGAFNWEAGKDFSLRKLIWGSVDSAWSWVSNIFSNVTEKLQKEWSELVGDKGISSLIWSSIKSSWDWITNKFSWSDTEKQLQERWANITGIGSIIWNALEAARNWFVEKFSWETIKENLQSDSNLISNLFDETIESVKNWFQDLFDFLPSVNQMKQYLLDSLPEWMQRGVRSMTGSSTEQDLNQKLEKLRSDLEDAQDRAANSRDSAGALKEAERIESVIQETIDRIKEISPRGRSGGIFNMPMSGGLATLHGQEAVIPLDTTEGKNILEQKTDMIYSESNNLSRQGSPVIIKGGDSISRPNIDRRDNSSTTIINNTVDPTRKNNHVY